MSAANIAEAEAQRLADKEFSKLRAQFAMSGHSFWRSNASDGPVRYFAGRWGMVRTLDDLDAAAAFLARVRGNTK